MSVPGLAERATRLRALHEAPAVLVLPNAWDPPSARRFAGDGTAAIATSSVAVARALGSDDGQLLSGAQMLAAVARICAAAPQLPVSADMEAGYALDAGAFVDGLLGAGAVGCNLEDTDHAGGGLRDVAEQAAWLAAVKAAGRAAGVDVVLNARVDVHLRGRSLEEGLERARAYRAAGADCVYPIGVAGDDAIGAYVEAAGTVNVLAGPQGAGPDLAHLAELGVARVSFGGGLAAVALDAASAAWQRFAR
jgi:2-methylisocitrate lyase-like PEP mutase family enzyme